MSKKLEILFQDDSLVAINKPYGWLTHKSPIARDAKDIVLQTLRDQIQRKVYPIHRIDRKTTGLLLLGLDPQTHKTMSAHFQTGAVHKTYYAIVRGYTENGGIIDYPLENEAGKTQEAISEYKTMENSELPWKLGKFDTSRYSLIKLHPVTGRMHQLRRHMNHLRHPIIGDRPHGCSKQNRMFKEKFGYEEMLLHAREMTFPHPLSSEKTTITAPFFPNFETMSNLMKFSLESI